MSKKRGLGRGLNALLGSAERTTANNEKHTDNEFDDSSENNMMRLMPIDRIQRGSYQPRLHFDQDSLQELADSIIKQGMIQPIIVRPNANGFELIAGERRWRAAQLANLHEIPVIIKQYDDAQAAAVSLIENIQREDLNPLEEARALQQLQEEFGMTHQTVAEAVGRSRAAVTNLLRLLDLNDNVKRMLELGELEMGHARAILGVTGEKQTAIAQKVIAKGLSVRATEALVKSYKETTLKVSKPANTQVADPDIQALEHRLADTLGSKVDIKHKNNGSGKLEVCYSSLDELEGILSHIH